jgi:murein DD-endopeptidase MepM/ murein hydrolase activator NlpD
MTKSSPHSDFGNEEYFIVVPSVMKTTLSIGFITLMIVPSLIPASTHAAYEPAPSSYYSNHNEEEDTSSRYMRERYSRSTQRAVNKLDDDEVEHMPVPVLFVSYAKIYPDFGDPRGGDTRSHEGQDILAPLRSFIVSPTDAVVTRTGKGSSAGTYVYTAAPGGETFRYMHLDEIADGIKTGTVLKPGDLIGYVGNTGNAAGGPTHLHFEIRDGRKAEDPYPRIDGSFTNEELVRALTALVKVLQEEIEDMR